MKTIRRFGTRGLILATLGVSISVGFASPTFAQPVRGGAVIVNPDGKVTYPGTLDGYYIDAVDINNSGQLVGAYTTVGDPQAFITGPDGMGMTDLTLDGSYISAQGINDSGQVVGVFFRADGYGHAFITGPGGMGMTDLGTLGGPSSYAYGINDSGQVVGVSDTTGGDEHAFITGPGDMGMTDLNSFVDLPDGGYLRLARGINNQGQVVVTDLSILVIPGIPEPASYVLMLVGLGLVGFMTRSKKQGGRADFLYVSSDRLG